MSTNAATISQVSERRRKPRKRMLVSGIIADSDGENACDCTIRDMHAHGAQIQILRKMSPDDKVYLVDRHNQVAYLATVAWAHSNRAGVAFVRSYSLNLALPPELQFLPKLLVEAKWRQVRALTKRGMLIEDAATIVGLTEEDLAQPGKQDTIGEKVELLLHQARKLLAARGKSDDSQ